MPNIMNAGLRLGFVMKIMKLASDILCVHDCHYLPAIRQVRMFRLYSVRYGFTLNFVLKINGNPSKFGFCNNAESMEHFSY